MAQRGKQPLKGWWSLPGGAVETGELLADAIKREVREETGLEIRPVEVLEIFERIMRDGEGAAEYHYVLIDYLCEIVRRWPSSRVTTCAPSNGYAARTCGTTHHRRDAGSD